MSDAWSPDHPVDRALVLKVLTEQFPSLPAEALQHIGSGWEHEVWRCGDVVLRFPHQQSALRSAHDVADALEWLAPHLPLAIPAPVLRARPLPDYPGHAVGYRWIDGRMPAHLALDEQERADAATPLARFVQALHAVPAEEAGLRGIVPEGPRGSMAERTTYGQQRAAQLIGSPFGVLAAAAADAMAEPPAECGPDERRVVHGDLHAGQVLFGEDRRLVGVIDWESLALGDPAFDLLMVYGFLPARARPTFWYVYGPSPAAARARHLALSYGLAMLAQGVLDGNDAVRDEAAFALRNALER